MRKENFEMKRMKKQMAEERRKDEKNIKWRRGSKRKKTKRRRKWGERNWTVQGRGKCDTGNNKKKNELDKFHHVKEYSVAKHSQRQTRTCTTHVLHSGHGSF